jgi:hypothetical protein
MLRSSIPRLVRPRWRAAFGVLLASAAAASEVGAQAAGPVVRLEGGMLNPSDPVQTTLAYGAAAGWQVSDRQALGVRYVRQSGGRNSGADVGRRARGFLTADWEYAFGSEKQYHRQVLVRVGAGALFRYMLATAPILSAGLEVRYPVGRRWSFVGGIEDDVGALPRQDFQSCTVDVNGNPVCTLYTYGGRWQHNYGFLVAAEWRPRRAARSSP